MIAGACLSIACGENVADLDGGVDASRIDDGGEDAAFDGGGVDAGTVDAGTVDAGSADAGAVDAATDFDGGDGGLGDGGFYDGGVDGGPDAGVPFQVVSTTPVADGTAIEPTESIVVALSKPVDPASVSAASFRVIRGGRAATGAIAFSPDGTVLTFTPTYPLVLNAVHTVELSSAIRAVEGSMLTPYAFAFTTREGSWSAPKMLDFGASQVQVVNVAVGEDGAAAATWSSNPGSGYNVFAATMDPLGAWTLPTPLESLSGNAYSSDVELTSAGALAVFSNYASTRADLYRAERSDGAWQPSTLVETNDAGNVSMETIEMAPNGDALVLYGQSTGGSPSVYELRWNARSGGAWLNPSSNVLHAPNIRTPALAMLADGSAYAAWSVQVVSGTTYTTWIMAAKYTASGWTVPAQVATACGGCSPWVAIDAAENGTAIVIFGAGPSIAAATSVDGTTWSTPIPLFTGSSAGQVAVGIAENDDAVLVFSCDRNIYVSHARADAGFAPSAATLLELGDGQAQTPQVVVDPVGNAIATWNQGDSGTVGAPYSIWVARYDSLTATWSDAIAIDGNPTTSYAPEIDVDASGRAVLVWQFPGASSATFR